MSRRDFLTLVGTAALWTTLGGALVALIRFLGFTEPETPARFELGEPGAYSLGAMVPVAEGRAFIARDERGLFAIVATCTHLGCRVARRDAGFECPCHGSRFDDSGAVVRGPAERPLERAWLTLDAGGRVVLDLGQPTDPVYRLPITQ